ncbi:MAG: nucleoside triphosphate pyrophosphohydrolase, partial [Gemmatimonadota bacterium]
VEAEVGDLLFSAVNAARLAGAHPSNALLRTIAEFERRCRAMLHLAAERGIDPGRATLTELDALWDETKRGPP